MNNATVRDWAHSEWSYSRANAKHRENSDRRRHYIEKDIERAKGPLKNEWEVRWSSGMM